MARKSTGKSAGKSTTSRDANGTQRLKAWTREEVDRAVHELLRRGVIEAAFVEAKPFWVLPYTMIIGKIRDQAALVGYEWFISGEAVPLTTASSSVASTPRGAAKHFAMQWHLMAARQGEAGKELEEKADALFELVNTDELWQT